MLNLLEDEMAIRIDVEKNFDETVLRIVGYVNDREIITLSNQIFGKWHTGSSTCLPSDIAKAAQYVECMTQVFEMAKNHGA